MYLLKCEHFWAHTIKITQLVKINSVSTEVQVWDFKQFKIFSEDLICKFCLEILSHYLANETCPSWSYI